MPVPSYGVWVGKPTHYHIDQSSIDPTPHINLFFKDDLQGSMEHEAAVNIKSRGAESRLVSWVINDFKHPIASQLETLNFGFHLLSIRGVLRGLDYLRAGSPIPNIQNGKLLPHDLPGIENDIIDDIKSILDSAISQNATVYVLGSSYGSGIHDVHMNQGSLPQFDNAIYKDGALLVHFPDKHWEAVFLAFASQRIPTDDLGLPYTNSRSLAEILEPFGSQGRLANLFQA
ncbi:hypothetical protein BG000_008489 [Podila horticola]|nr:hypothetical protein BG000_008489 [Podila horticola]